MGGTCHCDSLNLLSGGRTALAAIALAAALPAFAQYPGRVTKTGKNTPELRSIAVLEWTGEAGKPKASRLVPIAVLDGGELQDGSIYLARPEPLAVESDVEYELLRNGNPVGLYDIKNAGQEQGSWVGYGVWKPMPSAKPKPSSPELASSRIDDDASDRPTLHRKHHDGGSKTGSGGNDAPMNEPAPDPDRPTLHRSDSAGDNGSKAADPDRPKLKKGKSQQSGDVPYEEAVPGATDPDRPHLIRGKSDMDKLSVTPSLMGLPAQMQQVVAVSDARNRPPHPWSYSWANPADQDKMKSELEGIARDALGLKPPPAPPAPTPAHKRTPHHKAAKQAPAPLPVPLEDEQFRVFELSYGSGATMVLTAHTAGPLAEQKFVTLIAQPDLYGNVLVLFKSVTDAAHLDYTPRMKLIDAVDAMADNRGELLFELRGSAQRQFALYRVLRGQAERVFLGGGGAYGSVASE